jgi:hypothetical protein
MGDFHTYVAIITQILLVFSYDKWVLDYVLNLSSLLDWRDELLIVVSIYMVSWDTMKLPSVRLPEISYRLFLPSA